MKSEFQNSPEDRLIDELLHEQAKGPDEAFLQQIEAAVDAGAPRAVKCPAPRHYGRLAIAAGLALAAGAGIWWRPVDHKSSPRVLAEIPKMRSAPEDSRRMEIVPGGMKKDSLAHQPGPARSRVYAEGAQSSLSLPESESFGGLASNDESSLSGSSLAAGGGGGGGGRGAGSGSGLGMGSSPSSAYGLIGDSEQPARQPRARVVPPPGAPMAELGRSGGFAYRGADASPEQTSGDRYGTFIDQPWKSPDRDPLSTFSIDVDTASYGNVRRMIREGREIPRDAVRIEECINAFKYNYAQPKGDGPFAVSAMLAVCPWAPEHQLVRVAIKGREIEANKRPASNLVFLIDVSGSMQSPDKLPLLKQSMATLVEQLDERDRVAIVVYAGTEGVALSSTRLDKEGRSTVLKTLGKLESGGSTNGGAGIKRAYEIAMKEKINGGVNRVILATDGDFNVGVTGQESLVELVKDRAKGGVYLTVAGFGTGNLNDAMMDAITRDGNGNYFYIDSEREGRKVFLQNLSGTLVTIAKDVKIQVEFNPAKVGGYRLIGYANRMLRNEDFNNDKVDAGDIGAGHTVTAFYELTPPGAAAGTDSLKYQAASPKPAATTDEWLTVKLRHKHPDGDESSKIEFPLTGDALALDKTDADFQFATAAALFGMKLRGMDEVKGIAWEKVLELARPGLADDATEDRAEFVGLVKKLRGGKSISASPGNAEDPEEVAGPNVRVMRHQDGSRAVFTREPDGKVIVKKTFSPEGALTLRVTYKMDDSGNPMGCKIYDGMGNEQFTVRYGYSKSTGQLVEELMFDSRVKRLDPDTGKEQPVQKVSYIYDATGKRSQPVVFNYLPGQPFEQAFGLKSSLLEPNPFDEAGAAPSAGKAEVMPVDRER